MSQKNHFKSAGNISRVLLIVLALALGGNTWGQVTLYSENFGTGTTFPAGWSTTGTNTWTINNSNSSTPAPPFSGGSNALAGTSTNARILTYSNNLSTVGYSGITVLWAARRSYSNAVKLEWSPDGTNWNVLPVTDVVANSTWAWVNGGTGTRIAVPAGAAGVANLSFRWTYDSDGSTGVYRIDDFSVEGCLLPNQPSAISGSSKPCVGTSQAYSVINVAGVTYTWSLPAGWVQTGGATSNSITVTVGATSGNITVTPSNSCGTGTPSTFSVAVETIPSQPSAISGATSPCLGSSQTYSVTNVPGVTYNWTLPSGWTQTGGGTTNSIVVTVGTSAGSIKVTPSNTCGNGTFQQTSVTPVLSVPAQPDAITGSINPCLGSIQNYSVTNVTGVTYTWYCPSGWTISAGQGTNAITATVGANSGNITVTPSNACGNGSSSVLAVSVLTIPAQPGLISGNPTCCLGSSQVYSVPTTTGVTYTWIFPADWVITAGQGSSSVTVTVGATSGNAQVTPSSICGNGTMRTMAVTVITVPSQPSAITGNSFACKLSIQGYSVTNVAGVVYTWSVPAGWTITAGQGTNSITVTTGVASGNVTVTPSNSCGNGTPRILAVTIQNAAPAQPSPVNGNIAPCQGSSQVYSVVNVPGVNYAWNVPAGWTITAGQGTNSITVTVGSFSGNIVVSPSNTCGGGASRTLAVVTLPAVPGQPSPISGNATVCSGSSQTFSVVNVAYVTYSWVVPADWIIISGQGTNSIQVTVGNTSGNLTVTPSNSCGNGPSRSLPVDVQSFVPSQPGPINGNIVPCQGSLQTYSVTNTSGIKYTWSVPSGWIIVSGQATNSITVTVGVLSGTIQVLPSNACGFGAAASLPVTVSPLPAPPGPITGNTSICQNSLQTYSVTNIPGITYTWFFPADWVINSGQGNNAITVTPGITSGNIMVTPSNSCGNGVSETLNVKVNPNPNAYTGPNAIICEGASIQLGAPAVPGNTYKWTSIPPGFTSSVSNPLVTPTGTTTYILVETDPVSGCSNTDSVKVTLNQIITVTVNPVSLAQTICSGGTTNIILTSNITGTVFTWEALLTSGSGTSFSPSGSGNLINEVITNTSSLPSEVTYTITARANECTNSSTAVVVTINPVPMVNGQVAIVCSDIPAGITLGSSTNGVPAVSYNITNINSNGLTASAGSPSTGNGLSNTVIADDAWTNTTLNPVNVVYTVIPVSSLGCAGIPFTVTVTVNPKPLITNPVTYAICSGSTTSIALSASLPSTFNWTIGTITGGITGASAGSGTVIAQTLTNPGNTTDGTVQYIVTPTSVAGTCPGTSTILLVTVHPKPAVTNATTSAICSGTALNIPLTATVPSNFSWTIGTITGGITGAVAGNGNVINQVLTNPSNVSPGAINYIIVPTAQGNSCQGNPFTITVTVNPLPAVTASSSASSVCPGASFNLFSSSTVGSPPVILSENFNAATNSWTKTNVSTGGTPASASWTLRPDGYLINGLTIHSNDASQFYFSDSRTQNGTMTATTLVSPVLSTIGYSNLSLSFWHFYDFNSTTGESAKVEVSTNNGTSWTTVATYTSDRGGAASFQNENINLGAAYINSSSFLLRFNYYCGSNRGRYWAIDNVILAGTPSLTPTINWTSNPAGFSSTVANPTNVTQSLTTNYTVIYTNPSTTCSGNVTVTVTAFPVPEPTITADYCSVPGKIRLTAGGGGTYLWNTGETTQVIEVDVAGMYSVLVTNASGCSASAYLSVSNELVVNGNFSAGNTGFTSGYAYDPTANGLIAPESEYAINNNANYNHPNFWGYDHTSGTGTGNANFMIVNGAKYAPQPYVWKEIVSVFPNTNYYFSAWAISLNNVSPFAELRFSVNGVQVGTTAVLTSGQNILNNPWLAKDRFYGSWNSGSATTAVIEILDLNTSANGNDFGLDDISFGTLAQIPFTINPSSSNGTYCAGETLQLLANITGGRPPVSFHWSGPNGFTSTLQDPVIPNISVSGGGKYYLSVTDGYGCSPVTDSTEVIVLPLPTAGITGPTSVCQYSPSPAITFTGSGGLAPYTFVYKINGGANQSITTISGSSVSVSVPTSVAGTFTYTLVSVTSASNCFQLQTASWTIKVNALPTCIISGNSPICPESTGNIYSGLIGMNSYSWSVSGNGSINGSYVDPSVNVTAGATCNETFLLTLVASDVNGCNSICQEEVLVEDEIAPVVSCPADINTPADAGKTFATVTLPAPGISDNCTQSANLGINWTMTAPTAGSGTGFISSPYQFNTGTTTVTYAVTDACGNTASCSFEVVVTPFYPPDISCPANIQQNTSANLCTAAIDPGLPVINSGLNVTLTWVMTGATSGSGTGPIVPNPYIFNSGVTIITWIATNISGSDTCAQIITVTDNQPPTFTAPGPFSFCVEDISTAEYFDPTMDITPDRPEFYLFVAGSNVLDLDPGTFTDNCGLSCAVEIRWRIDFSDGTALPVLPSLYITGQPSAYGSDIQLPGNISTNLVHAITYQIVDCSGNVSASQQVNIIITPRPNVIKQ